MIKLKPLTKEHLTPFYTWLNDDNVINYSLTLFQQLSTEKEISEWYSSLLKDSKNYTTGIFLKESEVLIGYAGICNISNTNRSGEFFIFIGDKTQWGKGIGTQVTKQILAYGFEKLNLNRIMLTVSAPNNGGIRAYVKAGFKKEGVMRNACFREGQFHDKIMMSILRDEWE
jgi:RimJ/RimL family protein N-acetyltransferase